MAPALEEDSDPVAAIERDVAAGRIGNAVAGVERLMRSGAPDVRMLALAGKVAYLSGDPSKAESLLEEALKRDPKCAAAHHVLGNLFHDREKPDRAISAYRRAIRHDPAIAQAHNDLGTAYFAKGWYREAEECFREAAKLRPEDAQVQQNLGEVMRKLGRAPEARRSFQRALKLRLKSGLKRMVGRDG